MPIRSGLTRGKGNNLTLFGSQSFPFSPLVNPPPQGPPTDSAPPSFLVQHDESSKPQAPEPPFKPGKSVSYSSLFFFFLCHLLTLCLCQTFLRPSNLLLFPISPPPETGAICRATGASPFLLLVHVSRSQVRMIGIIALLSSEAICIPPAAVVKITSSPLSRCTSDSHRLR